MYVYRIVVVVFLFFIYDCCAQTTTRSLESLPARLAYGINLRVRSTLLQLPLKIALTSPLVCHSSLKCVCVLCAHSRIYIYIHRHVNAKSYVGKACAFVKLKKAHNFVGWSVVGRNII